MLVTQSSYPFTVAFFLCFVGVANYVVLPNDKNSVSKEVKYSKIKRPSHCSCPILLTQNMCQFYHIPFCLPKQHLICLGRA